MHHGNVEGPITVTSQTPTVRPFLLLAYALTWVLLGPWFYAVTVVYHGDIPNWLWAVAPVAFVGGWGPTVAALTVAARTGEHGAVRRLLGSLTIWRVPTRWYLVTIALPPLLVAASVFIVDQGPATLRRFDLGAALANIPRAYLLALPFGPLGQELGWRGFALPRLLSRFGPVKASLVLGFLWTFWHAPMMLWFPGAAIPSFMTLSVTSVAIFLVQITAETVLMTYLFLRTNGSVLLAVLAHLTFNTAESVLFGGLPPLAAELRPSVYLVNVALLAIVGVTSLAWLARRPTRPAAA